MLELRSGDAVVVVAPENGGRVGQITVAGLDLLVSRGTGIYDWGLFPMVPFAGRLRHGRLSFAGDVHRLPCGMPPHAIHGTTVEAAWRADHVDDTTAHLRTALGDPWPFPGSVSHDLRLEPGRLDLTLRVEADAAMPVTMGWHPWWRRRLGRGDPAALSFAAGAMYERDHEGIPTGQLLSPPPPGPWDDCFTELGGPPVVAWAGALTVTMEHSCDHVVVFDEPADAICVEPQTGPPDAANLGLATVITPERPLVASLGLEWRLPGATRG